MYGLLCRAIVTGQQTTVIGLWNKVCNNPSLVINRTVCILSVFHKIPRLMFVAVEVMMHGSEPQAGVTYLPYYSFVLWSLSELLLMSTNMLWVHAHALTCSCSVELCIFSLENNKLKQSISPTELIAHSGRQRREKQRVTEREKERMTQPHRRGLSYRTVLLYCLMGDLATVQHVLERYWNQVSIPISWEQE